MGTGGEVVVTLKTVLDSIGKTNRKIAIGLSNKTDHPWEAISVYFSSGTSDDILPLEVKKGDKVSTWGARRTSGPIPRGAVGVLTYYIPDLDKTLAIMYSVPFDYNLFRNWWNVNLCSGRKEASKELFREMDVSNGDKGRFKGDNSWHTRDLGPDLSVKGAMGSTGQSKLEIKVSKVGTASNT